MCFALALLCLVLLFTGCASSGMCFTEEACAAKLDAMTAEEIEAAKQGGELVTVCDLTDCIFVWVY